MKNLVVCLLICGLYPTATWALVPYNKPFTSPDGRFVVRLVSAPISAAYPNQYFDNPSSFLDCFAITDNQTKHSATLDQSLAVHSVRWTGDSTTLVVVEVIAHGSKCEFYHFNNGRWTHSECPPPHEGSAIYRLTKQGIGTTKVTLTYAVLPMSPHRPYQITFLAEAATGSVIKVLAKRSLNIRRWERLAEG